MWFGVDVIMVDDDLREFGRRYRFRVVVFVVRLCSDFIKYVCIVFGDEF